MNAVDVSAFAAAIFCSSLFSILILRQALFCCLGERGLLYLRQDVLQLCRRARKGPQEAPKKA